MKKPGVYAIRNVVTGEVYVGSSANCKRRWKDHRGALKHHRRTAIPLLQKAWDAHGAENFEFVFLEEVEDLRLLLEREAHWIAHFDSHVRGYNMTPTGTAKGVLRSAQTRARMSANHRRENSPETRAKISAARKGTKLSPEALAKRRLNYKLSPEALAKMSRKGWKHPAESRAKMSAAHRLRQAKPLNEKPV